MSKFKLKCKPPSNKTHFIRLSQLITTFGPGAIYDFPDQSLIVGDTGMWNDYYKAECFKKIYDRRLQDALSVNFFKTIDIDSTNQYQFRVPFVRFPEWYSCPSCKKIKSLKEWESLYKFNNPGKLDNRPICADCSRLNRTQLLTPASILVACDSGHIDDFPWVEWTHYSSEDKISKSCNNPSIKIKRTDEQGLEGYTIECENCGKKKIISTVFDNNFFSNMKNIKFIDKEGNISYPFSCSGRHPHRGTYSNSTCTSNLRAIQRNSLNLYNPKLVSSIIIPYTSNELYSKIIDSVYFEAIKSAYDKKESNENIMVLINMLSNAIKEDSYIVKKALEEILDISPINKIYSRDDYRREEYNTILSNNNFNDDDFKTEKQDAKKYHMPEIEEVVLIKKLREIVVLTGFTRLEYPDNSIIQDTNSKVVSIKNKNDWYPAYECRGEGIFIKFNQGLLKKWSSNIKVINRGKILSDRYTQRSIQSSTQRTITPEFILLHSIAHMLINELSFTSGYPASALKERIYCNTTGEISDMSGILIYTADSDSEGSLGGLVRQGKSDVLPNIIKRAIKRIEWCSSDPICRKSEGQGRDALNLSACHSCLLLPETSCEELNMLLDRTMIVGGLEKEDKYIGFFSEYLS